MVNYVDDSNSSLTFEDSDDASEYLYEYFKLLKCFYNLQKLKLNSDKTNLMVLNRPKLNHKAEKVQLKTNKETIKPKSQFKILGWVSNKRMSMDSHINGVASIIGQRIHSFGTISKYSNEETRLRYANSHLLSVLKYGMPL